jgi:hypothetical protein
MRYSAQSLETRVEPRGSGEHWRERGLERWSHMASSLNASRGRESVDCRRNHAAAPCVHPLVSKIREARHEINAPLPPSGPTVVAAPGLCTIDDGYPRVILCETDSAGPKRGVPIFFRRHSCGTALKMTTREARLRSFITALSVSNISCLHAFVSRTLRLSPPSSRIH